MSPPRVSVVVSCFNLGMYLDEAIDSVLAQTFRDFDILVVDDGSTDEYTRTLLASYSRPRTRVIRSENRGLPSAKNLGLSNTEGELVCMLDADDRLEPEMLARSVAALDENPGVAFVSHWLRTFGEETAVWSPVRCDFPALLDVNTVNGAALVRRTAIEAAGGFDDQFRDGCEDWDLWISIVERNMPGLILPEVLFAYRRRPGSMSQRMVRDVGHPVLYRRLAAKHAATFSAHAAALIERRESDIANLRRHVHDLSLEYGEGVARHVNALRDDVATAREHARHNARQLRAEVRNLGRALDELKAGVAARESNWEATRESLEQRLREQQEHLRSQSEALRAAIATAHERDAAANAAVARSAALEGSASWKLTRPLRRLADTWTAMRRPGRTG